MTEPGLFTLFLYLHVGAAIIAFGPTFTFPIIGALGSKDPMHAGFGVRVTEALLEKLVLPFAISMPFTGVGLIYFGHINLLDRSSWWLVIAIILYAITITIAVAMQRPLIRHLVKLTAGGPPPGGASGGPPPGASAAGSAADAGGPGAGGPPASGSGGPSGPPPEVLATVKKIQRNGKVLALLIIVIVLLMVARPQY